jgi:hypothetical protein
LFILIHDRFQFKTFCAVKLIMWGKMLLLINAAINWSHQLFRPLMFWWITGKEIFELKLSDVVYLLSVPIKNHYFLMWISDSLKREEVRWWWGEVGLLDHYDELHRLVDYWNMCLSYVALIHTHTHTHTPLLSLSLSLYFVRLGVTALLKTSCCVCVMIYTKYTKCIRVTITGITQIVLFWTIRSLLWLSWTFSSWVEWSLASCQVRVIGTGELVAGKESWLLMLRCQ